MKHQLKSVKIIMIDQLFHKLYTFLIKNLAKKIT